MMMVRDITPDRPQLDKASIALLESALQGYLSGRDTDGALQPVLRTIAREAREKRLLAEHLLLALKDVWFSLPEIRSAPVGEPQQRLLQRVVTLCIREYYAT